MDIKKLLAIESEAQEAMKTLAKEEFQIRQKIEADLARRVAEIEAEGKQALEMIRQESLTDMDDKITKIKMEYSAKIQEFTAYFSQNKHEWRRKIFHDVLRGEL